MQTSEQLKRLLPENLLGRGWEMAEEYRTAEPFPHIVIDNFFPIEIAERAASDFPAKTAAEWERFNNDQLQSKSVVGFEKVAGLNRQLLEQLNGIKVLRFLEQLTGIKGLIPDPYFYGRGLQQTHQADFLEIHVDSNLHPYLKIYRRVNVLIYLTRDWQEEYGGHLELWDKDMSHWVKKILPVFNRCIIFDISDIAFHGHPIPNNCPPEVTRNLLSLVYCTAEPAENASTKPYGALWQKRPEEPEILTEITSSTVSETLNQQLLPVGLPQLIRENNSLVLRVKEAEQNLQGHIEREKAWLNERIKIAEQIIRTLEEQEENLWTAHSQLLLEQGAAKQWARELEQKINSTQRRFGGLRQRLQKLAKR